MYKLAVVGNPINHSLSPRIFELFATQFKLDLRYDKILANDSNDFSQKVDKFFDNDGLALNITSPFKQLAYTKSGVHSMRSQFCQASNFMYKDDKTIYADTTDGIGLVTDIIENHNYLLRDKKVLILGSGFVLDSILLDIIVTNPSQIDILARDPDRLGYLTNKFACNKFVVDTTYDVIINTTPNIPDNMLFQQIKHIADGAFCYDLSYGINQIFLTQMQALNKNIEIANGLGMLVEQAKVAFVKLFDKLPDTQLVISNLAQ